MLYSKCNENTKTQFSSLRSLLLDEQLLWQLNWIRPMVALDMHYCALKQQSLQREAGAHKHNWPSFFPKIIFKKTIML